MKKTLFASLASSSSGNCFVIKQGDTLGLIDAGISYKRIANALSELGVTPEKLSFILITHEHKDHISGLKVLLKNSNPSIFVPESIEKYFKKEFFLSKIIPLKSREMNEFMGIKFIGFDVNHDSEACFGYRIGLSDKTIGFVTDIGKPSLTTIHFLKNSDYIVMESNYDKKMLMTGKYPHFLKQRIISPYGHLDNEVAVNLLKSVMHKGLKKVMLAHLSTSNNHPDIVYKRFSSEFKGNPEIVVASKDKTTMLF